MKKSKQVNPWLIALIITAAVCVLLTAAHLVYDAYAYDHASIIYYIARELW